MSKKHLPILKEPKLLQIKEPVRRVKLSRKEKVRGRIKYNRWRRENRMPAVKISDVTLKSWAKSK